ncbi:hypothetical protein SGFS_038120 [Streptomyces graminofaciens]|uniref:Pyrrolo-quinoline quinone repeat domain-containing protein n=1 Tax=Streptomyces graminofaciens TaxID=68212 RepID=A0ABM7F970_9ACTN|nr:PQQ-binding-like beta-propeller repeat protein [Streptomyces graminofaciens]BBC32518.1 hypothetical protein SGFS_038120 [Streptomyces graminofaciens]
MAEKQTGGDIRQTVETKPKSSEGSLAVRYAIDDLGIKAYYTSPGTWATDKVFVKSVGPGITALGIGSGKQAWKTSLPGPVCGATRHVTADNRTAVAFKSEPMVGDSMSAPGNAETSCDSLAFIDLDTGEKLWQGKLLLPGDGTTFDVRVTMTRGTVVAARYGGSVAFDMASGRRLWSTRPPDRTACEDIGYAGGKGLLALVQCGNSETTKYKVQKVAPRTGKRQWTYEVSPGIEFVNLVSAAPPVIAVAAGKEEITDLIVLDDRGAKRSSVTVSSSRFVTACDPGVESLIETCDGVVVGDTQLFVATKQRGYDGETAEGEAANEIVAFDLATGKSGVKFDGKVGRPIYPLRMSADRLITYRQGGTYTPSAVVAIDPSSGEESVLLLFPATDELFDWESGYTGLIYEQGRFFMFTRTVQGPTDKSEAGKEALVALGYESTG